MIKFIITILKISAKLMSVNMSSRGNILVIVALFHVRCYRHILVLYSADFVDFVPRT
jgi:hypothetical protein